MSLCHKFLFSNPNIFAIATQFCRLNNLVWNINYHLSCCKDIGKNDFVAKAQSLYFYLTGIMIGNCLFQSYVRIYQNKELSSFDISFVSLQIKFLFFIFAKTRTHKFLTEVNRLKGWVLENEREYKPGWTTIQHSINISNINEREYKPGWTTFQHSINISNINEKEYKPGWTTIQYSINISNINENSI